MYEFIKGKIDFIGPEYIVIENQGIGYQIYTPNPYIFSKFVGETQQIFVYFHVREDAQQLYGFQTRQEKYLFTKLLSVSGIGPKGALAILASGEPEQVVQAIEQENEAYLVKFPGVGKKTARQIILDLKGKLIDFIEENDDLHKGNSDDLKRTVLMMNQELEEAVLALEALGYSKKEIQRVLPHIQNESLTTDQYIKLALQKLLK